MNYDHALKIAEEVKNLLAPHCERIEIVGSIRRLKLEVKDIEIVAIPKPYETGIFESGVASVINQWEKVKGELEFKGRPGVKQCKYTQRLHPTGIVLDIFFAERDNWGYIFAIRTGSANYSHQVLAKRWTKLGYKGDEGFLTYNGKIVPVREEITLFNLLNISYTLPQDRTA
jgi:DNA polymerase/3'-5' exonuclease PolX